MQGPVRMLVANSMTRANQDAAVLRAMGFDTIVTGPTGSVIVRTAEGDSPGQDAWGNPFPVMWVVFAFNKTPGDPTIIE